jgi:hypothetical protein
MRRPLEPGEAAYLTPKTVGAARECYRHPRVVVVAVDGPYATVRIATTTRPRAVIPPTPPVMDETAAAWVRQHVLCDWSDDAAALLHVCPCQYGPCGHCTAGRHDQCAHRTPGYSDTRRSPLTYLLSRRRFVLAEVWPADGRCCTWRCPCPDPACAVPVSTGRELTTHVDNVVRTLPAARPARATRRPTPPSASRDEVLTLW